MVHHLVCDGRQTPSEAHFYGRVNFDTRTWPAVLKDRVLDQNCEKENPRGLDRSSYASGVHGDLLDDYNYAYIGGVVQCDRSTQYTYRQRTPSA